MSAPASYYEEAMTTDGALALLSLEESPWLPMYREAAGWLLGHEPLIDLGCGTGRFAVACAESGHDGGYTGLDFAPDVLVEAGAYIKASAPAYPVDDLRVRDLREWQPDDIRVGHTVYACLEVLEHLDDDLGLVERVPGGHRLIFSVPSYGSTSHVRRFPSPASVWERYAGLVLFRRWSLIEVGDSGHAIHVLDSTRRVDSWR